MAKLKKRSKADAAIDPFDILCPGCHNELTVSSMDEMKYKMIQGQGPFDGELTHVYTECPKCGDIELNSTFVRKFEVRLKAEGRTTYR